MITINDIKNGECFTIELYERNVPVPFMKTELGCVDLRCGGVVNKDSYINISPRDAVTRITLRQAADLATTDRLDLHAEQRNNDKIKIGDLVAFDDWDGKKVYTIVHIEEGDNQDRIVKLRNDDGTFGGFAYLWAISEENGSLVLEAPAMYEIDTEVTERD